MQYSYQCVIKKDPECGYLVIFPDWEPFFGGVTHGYTWGQALYMAQDLLGLMCFYQEKECRDFPASSKFSSSNGCYPHSVFCDTEEYGKVVDFFKRRGHGCRWRNAEKSRKRYLYPELEKRYKNPFL